METQSNVSCHDEYITLDNLSEGPRRRSNPDAAKSPLSDVDAGDEGVKIVELVILGDTGPKDDHIPSFPSLSPSDVFCVHS